MNEKKETKVCELISDGCMEKFSYNDLKLDSLYGPLKKYSTVIEFAREAHGSQKRKYTGEPYINHPLMVAKWVSFAVRDDRAVKAAILHDVLEDTEHTHITLRALVGHFVTDLVLEVTDISLAGDGNREVRKEIDRKHIDKASYLGKTIKLADLIDNTSTIVKYDKEFAKIYMHEKKLLLEVLEDGNAYLYQKAKRIVDEYYKNA